MLASQDAFPLESPDLLTPTMESVKKNPPAFTGYSHRQTRGSKSQPGFSLSSWALVSSLCEFQMIHVYLLPEVPVQKLSALESDIEHLIQGQALAIV